MKRTKQLISVLLCAALCLSMFVISAQAKTAKKYVKSISVKKKATVTIPADKKSVTKSFKVNVKVSGKASAKFTAKSGNKSVATVKVSGKKIKVTAKKAGTAKIKVTTKAKGKKGKKLSKTLTLTVKKSAKKTTPAVTPAQPATQPATEAPTEAQTEAPTEAPSETTTEAPTEAPTEPEPDAYVDEEEDYVYLEYSPYIDSKKGATCQSEVIVHVYEAKENAKYFARLPENDVAALSEDGTVIYSLKTGETYADVYEQLPGKAERLLGTLKVKVTAAEMGDAAHLIFADTDDFNEVWLKLNFDKANKSFDFKAAIQNCLCSEENGTKFNPKDYTVDITTNDKDIVSVSEDGVVTGLKNGSAFVEATLEFTDGSSADVTTEFKVSGKAIEKVDGYSMDTIRDYVIGLDTPVELSDGTKTPLINFDNAATTPALKAVQELIDEELKMYGSIGRGFSQKSNHSTDIYNSVRDKVLEFLGADPEFYTCFYTNSTTDGLNKLASALVESRDTVVLTTRIEHHANDLGWRERCDKVLYAEVDEKGRVIYDDIEKLLKENKVDIVSVSAASNVTGYVNDVHRVAKMAHKYGAKIVVDGAQIVAHRKFSMVGDWDDKTDDIDFIAFSAHKMYSPYGGGAVVGLTEELNKHMPEFYGGGTIKVVGDDWSILKSAPAAYEAGSPNYPGVVGLGKAIDVLSTVGLDKIEEHEKVLNRKLIDGLKKLSNVIIYGDSENIDDRVGVVTFNFSDINTYYVAQYLSELGGVATRRGAFCAHPYVWRLMGISDERARGFESCTDMNTAGMVRVSFGIYNTEEEVQKFLDIMPKVMEKAKFATQNGAVEPAY